VVAQVLQVHPHVQLLGDAQRPDLRDAVRHVHRADERKREVVVRHQFDL
jgi:hypothetical protein